jgi:hypothetical protein
VLCDAVPEACLAVPHAIDADWLISKRSSIPEMWAPGTTPLGEEFLAFVADPETTAS